MRIYSEDSPEADAERERLRQALERRARYRTLRGLAEAAAEHREALHGLNLHRIETRVDLGPAERLAKLCPECGKPDTRFHGCSAKE